MNLLKKLFGDEEEIENEQLSLPACTHKWQVFSKTYAPPRRDAKVEGLDQRLAEKALLGVTTYLWQCHICSAIRKEEMIGSDELQLTELCEKVDKFGMQYVEQDDKTYAIARWVPPDAGTTPVR